MFTGLIEEIGKISRITPISGGVRIDITASEIMDDVKIDDSIAVNGVCLTTVKINANGFTAEAVGETLKKTTLANIKEHQAVNLERAVRLSDRLGGHLVQGHVNGIAQVSNIQKLGENYFLEVEVPAELTKYIIDEGSITVDGISLTVARLTGRKVGVSVIPHTWKTTNLASLAPGYKVNIETDVLAKYVEKLLYSKTQNDSEPFSDKWFKEMGY